MITIVLCFTILGFLALFYIIVRAPLEVSVIDQSFVVLDRSLFENLHQRQEYVDVKPPMPVTWFRNYVFSDSCCRLLNLPFVLPLSPRSRLEGLESLSNLLFASCNILDLLKSWLAIANLTSQCPLAPLYNLFDDLLKKSPFVFNVAGKICDFLLDCRKWVTLSLTLHPW